MVKAPDNSDGTADFEKSIALHTAVGAKAIQRDDVTVLQFQPFAPTVGGLITARKVCRSEMAKIG
jgi:hypothetical protein